MAERIAALTVIRGNGECQAFMNGVVNAEIERLQVRERERHEAEMAELKRQYRVLNAESSVIRAKRNKMLAQRLDELKHDLETDSDSDAMKLWVKVFSFLYGFASLFVVREW